MYKLDSLKNALLKYQISKAEHENAIQQEKIYRKQKLMRSMKFILVVIVPVIIVSYAFIIARNIRFANEVEETNRIMAFLAAFAMPLITLSLIYGTFTTRNYEAGDFGDLTGKFLDSFWGNCFLIVSPLVFSIAVISHEGDFRSAINLTVEPFVEMGIAGWIGALIGGGIEYALRNNNGSIGFRIGAVIGMIIGILVLSHHSMSYYRY